MHILCIHHQPYNFPAILWDAIMYLLQLQVEPNICGRFTIHLAMRHLRPLPLMYALDKTCCQSVAHTSHQNLSHEVHRPFLTHSHLYLLIPIWKLRWEVPLRASVLRSRTLLAKRMNTMILTYLRVQDCLLVQDQRELRCLNTIRPL
jgi:hypothetical protein